MKNRSNPYHAPKTLNLPQPKLLLPTLLCPLLVILFFITSRSSLYFPFLSNFDSYLLKYTLGCLIMPFIPALAIYLLHRLLELAIHRTFRPIHLLPIAAIIFSTFIFIDTDNYFIYPLFYLIVGAIFYAIISSQNFHHLTHDPAHFRNSLLATGGASLALGFLNFASFATFAFFSIDIPNSFPSIFFAIAIVFLLPLQLALTFLTLAKLTPAREANLLSRHDSLLIYASFILAVLTILSYTVIIRADLAHDYIPDHQHSYINQPIPPHYRSTLAA